MSRAVAADGEPEKVESLGQRHHACLVLVERQSSGSEPLAQPGEDLFGLFPGANGIANAAAAAESRDWNMYMPTFLVRGHPHPSPGDIRGIEDLDALRDLYRLTAAALAAEQSPAEAIDASTGLPGWVLLVGAQYADCEGNLPLAQKLRVAAVAHT